MAANAAPKGARAQLLRLAPGASASRADAAGAALRLPWWAFGTVPEEAGLGARIYPALSALNVRDVEALAREGARIRELIRSVPLPAAIAEQARSEHVPGRRDARGAHDGPRLGAGDEARQRRRRRS
jgi:hypothetical protein